MQQAPEAQVVPPSQLLPPHWPQTGTVEGLGWVEVVVVVVVLMLVLVLVVLVVRVVAELVEEDETGGLVLKVEPMGPNLMLADNGISRRNLNARMGEHTESNVGIGVVGDHVLEFTGGGRAATTVGTKLGRVGREVGVEPKHVGVELAQSQYSWLLGRYLGKAGNSRRSKH